MNIKIPETEIKIKVKPVNNEKQKGLKAYIQLDFGLFIIHGFTLRDSKYGGGLWLVMPSNNNAGKHFQFFYVNDADFKKKLEKAAIEAYEYENIPVTDTPLRNEEDLKDSPF